MPPPSSMIFIVTSSLPRATMIWKETRDETLPRSGMSITTSFYFVLHKLLHSQEFLTYISAPISDKSRKKRDVQKHSESSSVTRATPHSNMSTNSDHFQSASYQKSVRHMTRTLTGVSIWPGFVSRQCSTVALQLFFSTSRIM